MLVVVPNHNRHEDPGRHAAYLDDAFDDDEETPYAVFARMFNRVWWPFDWWLWAGLLVLTTAWITLLGDSQVTTTTYYYYYY